MSHLESSTCSHEPPLGFSWHLIDDRALLGRLSGYSDEDIARGWSRWDLPNHVRDLLAHGSLTVDDASDPYDPHV